MLSMSCVRTFLVHTDGQRDKEKKIKFESVWEMKTKEKKKAKKKKAGQAISLG